MHIYGTKASHIGAAKQVVGLVGDRANKHTPQVANVLKAVKPEGTN